MSAVAPPWCARWCGRCRRGRPGSAAGRSPAVADVIQRRTRPRVTGRSRSPFGGPVEAVSTLRRDLGEHRRQPRSSSPMPVHRCTKPRVSRSSAAAPHPGGAAQPYPVVSGGCVGSAARYAIGGEHAPPRAELAGQVAGELACTAPQPSRSAGRSSPPTAVSARPSNRPTPDPDRRPATTPSPLAGASSCPVTSPGFTPPPPLPARRLRRLGSTSPRRARGLRICGLQPCTASRPQQNGPAGDPPGRCPPPCRPPRSGARAPPLARSSPVIVPGLPSASRHPPVLSAAS